jgi:phosphoesterase RecJ-like protein
MNSTQCIQCFKDALNRAREIVIVAHQSPDADTIGSALALWHSLQISGHHGISLLCTDDIPDQLSFLPNIQNFTNKIVLSGTFNIHGLIVSLDTASVSQMGALSCIVSYTNNIINIDHHTTNTHFGLCNLVNPSYASTAELLYEILIHTELPINDNVATCLLSGIAGDTLGFAGVNTTSKSLEVASKLVTIGADLQMVMRKLFMVQSLKQTQFEAFVFSNLQVDLKGKLVWVVIEEETSRMSREEDVSTSNIAARMQYIQDVEIAIVFVKQAENDLKVSFRSGTEMDVSVIAAKYGGGGHTFAAGCNIVGLDTNEAIRLVLNDARELINR